MIINITQKKQNINFYLELFNHSDKKLCDDLQ